MKVWITDLTEYLKRYTDCGMLKIEKDELIEIVKNLEEAKKNENQ